MKNNFEMQKKLDLIKWFDSETKHIDMCGAYPYCEYCNKDSETPCADALDRSNATEKMTEIKEMNKSLGKNFDYEKVQTKKANRKSLTFAEKHALSSEVLKYRYDVIKDALTSDSKTYHIKSRISKQCDTFRVRDRIVAKVTIIGTSLRINLALDPNDDRFMDGKMPHTDMSHKHVYEIVPFQFKVNSKLALKRALVLIDALKAELNK